MALTWNDLKMGELMICNHISTWMNQWTLKNKLYEILSTTNATNVYKCWIRSDTVYHHLPTKNNLQKHSSFNHFPPIIPTPSPSVLSNRDACFWSSFLGSHVASPSAIVARHFPMERCSAHCRDAPDSAESHGAHVATFMNHSLARHNHRLVDSNPPKNMCEDLWGDIT